MTNPAYTRRQELVCTPSEHDASGDAVLYDKEIIYIRIDDTNIRSKMGDGVTRLADLPYLEKISAAPFLSVHGNDLHVGNLLSCGDYDQIQFYKNGDLFGVIGKSTEDTVIVNLSTAGFFDGIYAISAKAVGADINDSHFSNSVMYGADNFPVKRKNLSRVFFPFYGKFPLKDINSRTTLSDFGDYATVFEEGKNGYPCMSFTSQSVSWWNEKGTFRRSDLDVFPSKEITMEFWIAAPNSTSGVSLFSSNSGWNGSSIPYSFRFRIDHTEDGRKNLWIDASVNSSAITKGDKLENYDLSKWNHIVVTQEGNGDACHTKIYCNGMLEQTITELPFLYNCQTNDALYTIGAPCGSDGTSFDGYIDTVGIYDFVWKPEQVKAVYEAEKGESHQYYVNGIYILNDVLNLPMSNIEQQITFHDGDGGEWQKINIQPDAQYTMIFYNSPRLHTAYLNGEFLYEKFKTLNFGDTPQRVSKDFYDYLTANAVKQ